LIFRDKLAQEEVVLVIEIETVKLPEDNYREENN